MDMASTTGITRRSLLKRSLMTAAGLSVAAPIHQPVPGYAAGAPAVKGGTLRVAIDSEPLGPDPARPFSRVDRYVDLTIYDTLFTFDEKLRIQPSLVARWETPSATEYLWHLQPGVRFHDGTPFDASAVKFNIDRIQDPKNNSPSRSLLSTVAGVDVVNPTTVHVKLTQPNAGLLSVFADIPGLMASPAAMAKSGSDYLNHPIGTGPFVFGEWVRDEHLSVKRSPSYWRRDPQGAALPYLDGVMFRAIPDMQAKLTALLTRQVDVIDSMPVTAVATVKQQAQYVPAPPLGYVFFFMKVDQPPFNDARVRQALCWAIDRPAIVQTILRGTATVAQGPLPPASWAYDPRFTAYTPRDVGKARQLLNAAGASTLNFSFLYPSEEPFTSVAQVLKSNWAEAGVTANLQQQDFSTLLQNMYAGKFAALMIDYSGRIDPDVSVGSFFATGGLNNAGKYSNPQVDRLLAQARSTSVTTERAFLYREVQRIVMHDAPIGLIYYTALSNGIAKSVRGYQLMADGTIRLTNVWLQR